MSYISKEGINKYLKENSIVLCYFSSEDCGVCHSLKPKVIELLKSYPNIKYLEINSEVKNLELLSYFSIFVFPAIIIYVEGKESYREARFIALGELEEYINRYNSIIYGS